jgi:hypothetical protein
MKSKNDDACEEWQVGELVTHSLFKMYPHAGIILSVKKIVSGWDIEVFWSLDRIGRHHSNCLEIV